MFKKLTIRFKLITLYVNMVAFSLPLLIYSYMQMSAINTMEIGTAGAILQRMLVVYPLWAVVYVSFTVWLGRKLAEAIAIPIKDLTAITENLSKGNINLELNYESEDEVGQLYKQIGIMINGINEQTQVLNQIADNYYPPKIRLRSKDDILNKSINDIIENNIKIISEIKNTSAQVKGNSEQISAGSQMLASGATEQAAAIEQLNANINEINIQAQKSREMTLATVEEMKSTDYLMQKNMENMQNMTKAMHTIDTSSKDIEKVIKVIDDIAFQTNILALNAAVEAARAGQHGKGFAVVAEEVRNLASKSAVAAQETSGYIANSIKHVEEGNKISKVTEDRLKDLSEIIYHTNETMKKLSQAYEQQTVAISEITVGVGQISGVVQGNSAAAEEAAASSEELSAQANYLKEIVNEIHFAEENAKTEKELIAAR